VLFTTLGAEEARTDAEGRFRLEALPAGSYRLRATHPRYAPAASAPLSLDGRTPRRDLELRLEAGGAISGRVVSLSGAPVGFAKVRFVYDKDTSLKPARQLFCDAEGRFTAEGLPRVMISLSALSEAASSAPEEVDLSSVPSQDDVELILENDGVIGGVVVSPEGEPRSDVVVRARIPQGVLELQRPAPSELTDPDGRFLLRGLEPGSYEIQASFPGTGGLSFAEGDAATVEAETGRRDLRIVLEEDGALRGRVRFSDGTAPERFSVALAGLLDQTPFEGNGGEFLLPGVPPGEHQLWISGPDFEDEERAGPFLVSSGKETDVGVISVARGRTIRGRVLTARGAPVAGARVIAARSIGDFAKLFGFFLEFDEGKEALSGEDGSFLLAGMGDHSLVLVADHPAAGRSAYVRLPAGEGDAKLDLELQPYGSLEGTITRGGAPVQALLELRQAVGGSDDDDVDFMVTSDADGSYRFDRLSAGRYQLIYGSGYRLSLRVIITDDDERKEAVEIRAGEVTRLDLDFPRKAALLVRALRGSEALEGSIFLFPGARRFDTPEALEEAAGEAPEPERANTDPLFAPRMSLPAHTAILPVAEAGTYTLCALTGSMGSGVPVQLSCRVVQLALSPDVQELTLEVR
jgi:hypothetical protein